jgi:hypothetical protein
MLTAIQNSILVINGIFNDDFSNSDHVATNDRIVVTPIDVLSPHLPKAVEETSERNTQFTDRFELE